METHWREAQDALRKDRDALQEEMTKAKEIINNLQKATNELSACSVASDAPFLESRSSTEQYTFALAATRR
jgi:uncharacterized protein YlxW (UPF0749 family)